MRVLVVSAEPGMAVLLTVRLKPYAAVDVCEGFDAAREHLARASYDLLLSDVRLGPYNGLNLAYLVQRMQLKTRMIVFSDFFDPCLASEAVVVGASYESAHRVVAAALTTLSHAV